MSDDKSILLRLEELGQKAPRVKLKGTERNDKAAERYEILGEIARGGVGLVHKGRDNDVGRDVALKVLRDEHLQTPELIQRFVEEAQIGGQLQHPGIVPVYELGLRGDRRPFFAMKLVKGETLAARLANRKDPSDGRRGLLAVFREVCRTMAYAHARGVIHRDLKPSNVMIGNFGEVQVVDWGFAKVLRKGGVADERLVQKAERDTTMISTVRSGDRSASVAGSVMGTPAYMPPEQAMGRVEDLDEKSDLFSLGAMLCEILTGSPPYASKSGDERMSAAAKAALGPAIGQLDACGADRKLVGLAKTCLQPLPKDRPESAEAVADEIAAYLTSAEGRAHRARIQALKAEARVGEQRRARRFTTVIGSSVVAVLVIAVAAFLWVDAGKTERARERQAAIDLALQDASRLRAAKDWAGAEAAAQRAFELGHRGTLAAQIRRQAEAEVANEKLRDEERTLLTEMERVRAMGADHVPPEKIEAAYQAAIRGGVDVEQLKASEYAPALAAAFDAWANARTTSGGDPKQIHGWARALDPQNNRWRDAIDTGDADALEAMVKKADLPALQPTMIVHIARACRAAHRYEVALELVEPAVRLHPGDFWLQLHMAWAARDLRKHELAARHGLAALAIRPDSIEARHWAGIFLQGTGDLKGAYELWRGALERKPDWTHGWIHVVYALVRFGRKDEAHEFLNDGVRRFPNMAEAHVEMGNFLKNHMLRPDKALTSYKRALKLDAANADAQCGYGMTLLDKGLLKEAVAVLEQAVADHPKLAHVVTNLGEAYLGGEKHAPVSLRKAIECFRKALELRPNLVHARVSLANALSHSPAKVPEAVRELRKAVAQEPWSARARRNLGLQLMNLQKYDEAVPHLKKATRLMPEDSQAWQWLTQALMRTEGDGAAAEYLLKRAEADPKLSAVIGNQLAESLGRHAEAVVLFKRALKDALQPALAHYAIGTALNGLGRFDEALPHFKKSLDLKPDHAEAWCNYGWCLRALGRWSEAIDAIEKGHALGRKRAQWPFPSAQWLADTTRLVKLEPKLNALMAGADVAATPDERLRLAEMLFAKKRFGLAIDAYERVFREDPRYKFGQPMGQINRAIRMTIAGGEACREKAVKWFREWLEWLRPQLKTLPAFVQRQIYWWKKSPWFAVTRRADAHEEWKQFWADAEALQKQAGTAIK